MHTEKEILIPALAKSITYRIGKSQQGNDALLDLARPIDIWFHLAGDSSPHVIANMDDTPLNKKQRLQIIKQGALLCKQHSRKKSEKDVEIVYCNVADIEKTNVPGTVIAHKSKYIVV